MKYNTIVIGDFHIHDTVFNNLKYNEWLVSTYRALFEKINKIIQDNSISKVVLAGDIFDSPPKDKALLLFREFIELIKCNDLSEIVMFDGNHEVISGNSKKVYYISHMREYFEKMGITVYDYHREKDILYCSHEFVNRLERLNTTQKLIYTHFRSGISEVAADEIDVVPMQYKSDLIIAGDIHKRLAYDKIVYTGSPMDTSFSNANTQPDHTPSVLLLNESTLEWKWEDTLVNEHRKVKVIYPNVKKFLEDVEFLKQEALADKNFLKIIIQDKKHNLKKINKKDYEDFAILEFVRVDLEVEKENKEVVSKIAESLSKNNVSDTLLDFILQNNEHPEWIDSIKGVYANYERGIK